MPEATTALVPFELPEHVLAELAALFPSDTNSDLTEGVAMSFAVVTFRGKVWRVRYKGEDRVIKTPTGDPAPAIVAVIVKSSPAISKLYYSKAYTEGDDAPPLCFSLDGIRPDQGSVEKQSPTCAACPHNAWGSRITENGSKGKACADNRRLAVVPYPDLRNEMFGGPMLLRVPPTSLQELWRFGNALKQTGLPYQAVVVKISFDYELAYPKLMFQAIRALTAEEAAQIREHMDSDTVLRMLMEPVPGDETGTHGDEGDDGVPAEPPAKPVQPAPSRPASPPPTKPKPAPAPAPEPAEAHANGGLMTGFGISTGEEREEEEEAPAPAKAAAPAQKRTSPAKAAVAPVDTVGSELNSMITGLLAGG